jgi:hypothetical protein
MLLIAPVCAPFRVIRENLKENTMKRSKLAMSVLTVCSFACALAMPARAAAIDNLPIDRPMTVSNIEFACTGVGDREQRDARWNEYPVKLEAVGGYGQYLAGEDVTLAGADSAASIHVKCGAPWVLMRLAPGRYSATVEVPGAGAEHVAFAVPATGQRRIIVRFSGKTEGRETGRIEEGGRT